LAILKAASTRPLLSEIVDGWEINKDDTNPATGGKRGQAHFAAVKSRFGFVVMDNEIFI